MSAYEGNNKRIARNTLLLYFRMGVSMLVSLYTARIVLGTLGEVDYGILNVVTGCVAIFTFLNGALSGSTSRFLTFELGRDNQEQLKKTFSATVFIHIALAIAIVILSETIGLWLLMNKLVIPAERMAAAHWAYQIGILSMVIGIIQVPYGAAIIAHEKMDIYAYMSIFDVGAKLALAFLIQVIGGDKMIIWAIMTMIVGALYTIFYIGYCRRQFSETRCIRFIKDKPLYKQLFSYSWWDLLGQISGMLQGQGINILLNMFFGPVMNTARAISYQVQGALTQFANNFMLASRPQIIKLYAADKTDEMMRLVYLSSCMAFYLSFVLTLPLCLELRYVLNLWLGEYPAETIPFTMLILVNSLIVNIKSSRVAAIHATGHIKLTNITVGIILCSIFPVAYVLLRMGFDATSVFVALIAITFIAEVVAVFVLRRYVRFSVIQYWLQVYGRCALVAACSYLPVYAVHSAMEEGFVRLIAVCATSVIVVGTFIYSVGINKETRASLNNFIKQFFFKLGVCR
ncbi:MAG: multidrug transporter [Rikenellaceae bacterium]|nr:multidrug transporter [Rikenellaceae bacterium]